METLYFNDSYLKEFETKVKSVKDGKYVVLEETAFYPESGGQPYDLGIIKCGSESYNVVFVGKFSGSISHEVEREGLKKGDVVTCSIDWDRRYKLMRSHTAAHVLSYVFHKESDAKITGNQLGLDECRIDFSLDEFDKDKIRDYVEKANSILREDVPVSVEYISREKALEDSSLFKLAKALPESLTELRVVSIGNYDRQADGGTHVAKTSEVGSIVITNMKNKGSGNRRVYFKLV